MMVPVIGLIQAGEQAMADRYTYLPLIGPVLSLVWLLSELASSRTDEVRSQMRQRTGALSARSDKRAVFGKGRIPTLQLGLGGPGTCSPFARSSLATNSTIGETASAYSSTRWR